MKTSKVSAALASRCEHCGSIISERYLDLYQGILHTLWDVFLWCKNNNRHEFTRKEIKHLFRSESDTARFGDLVLFGGLVYKNKRASYGLNMERCNMFFNNLLPITCTITKNPVTKVVTPVKSAYLYQIKGLSEFLDKDSKYLALYKPDKLGYVQLNIDNLIETRT